MATRGDRGDIPDDVRELGEALGMSYALKIQALGSPALQRVASTLGKLQDAGGALRESQNSGCQNGQCRRELLEELLDAQAQRGQLGQSAQSAQGAQSSQGAQSAQRTQQSAQSGQKGQRG
jgi:hypothetical protein